MSNLLSSYTVGRDNNFNLIRFVAASLVLFTHSFALAIGSGDAEPLRANIGMTLGGIAVDIFFITSGFLITSSYFARNNIIAFVWARILRIYPALMVAIMFCVFGVGLWFTTNKFSEYIFNPQTFKYLVRNLILFLGVEHTLPGVFLDVPYKGAVNGALWTLPYEVRMYAILAFILGLIAYWGKWVKLISTRNAILFVSIFSICVNFFNHFQTILPGKFIHLFTMFFLGVAFFIWQDKIRLSHKLVLFGLPLLLISTFNKDVFFIFYCLLLPFLIFYAAYVPSGLVRKFNDFGDYSYGIYIYAFPIQQSIASIIPNVSVFTMVVSSFICTLILAMISWHFIEKRFLTMKGAYIYIECFMQNNCLTRRFTQSE